MKEAVTCDRLKELLRYDPETGVFVWLKNPRHRAIREGNVAGSLCKGRLQIGIDQRFYRASRLAWLYVHGEWPKHEIDHINGDKSDNRIANLRDVSRLVNQQNIRKALRHNATGILGASRINRRFRAKLTTDGVSQHLGYFDTPEEAHTAYVEAKRRLHQGCTL